MNLDIFVSTAPLDEANPFPARLLENSGFSFSRNLLGGR